MIGHFWSSFNLKRSAHTFGAPLANCTNKLLYSSTVKRVDRLSDFPRLGGEYQEKLTAEIASQSVSLVLIFLLTAVYQVWDKSKASKAAGTVK